MVYYVDGGIFRRLSPKEEEEEKPEELFPTREKSRGGRPSIYETPSVALRQIADEAEATREEPVGGIKSPLFDFFRMQSKMGPDVAKQRIKDAYSVWNTYYKPYGGAGMVWNMAKSPYSTAMLEELAVEGRRVLSNTTDSEETYLPEPKGVPDKEKDFLHTLTGPPRQDDSWEAIVARAKGAGESEALNKRIADEKARGKADISMTDPMQVTKEHWEDMVYIINGIAPEKGKYREKTMLRERNVQMDLERIRFAASEEERELGGVTPETQVLLDEAEAAFEAYLWGDDAGIAPTYTFDEMVGLSELPPWEEPRPGAGPTAAQLAVYNRIELTRQVWINTALLTAPWGRALKSLVGAVRAAYNTIRGITTLERTIRGIETGGTLLRLAEGSSGSRWITALAEGLHAGRGFSMAGEMYASQTARALATNREAAAYAQHAKGTGSKLLAEAAEETLARTASAAKAAKRAEKLSGAAATPLEKMAFMGELQGKFGGTVGMAGATGAAIAEAPAIAAKADYERSGTYMGDTERLAQGLYLTTYQAELAGDTEAVMEMERWAKEEIRDEVTGEILKPAFGDKIIVDGKIDETEMSIFSWASQYVANQSVELEYELIASGFAPSDAKINPGTIMEDETGGLIFVTFDEFTNTWTEDTVWTAAYRNAQTEWNAQLEMAQDNELLYIFLTHMGMPLTGAGWGAKWNKMSAHGLPTVFVDSILTGAEAMAGAYFAVPAMIEWKIKIDKDPVRLDLLADIYHAGATAEYSSDRHELPFDMSRGELNATKILFLVEHGYTDDPTLKRLARDVRNRELALINEPTYSWMGIMAYASADFDDARSWLQNNYNSVRAMNMGIDLVAQAAILKGYRGMRHGRPRTAEGLLEARGSKRKIDKATKFLSEEDFGHVDQVLNGTSSVLLVQRLRNMMYGGKKFAPDADMVQAKAKTVLDALREKGIEAAAKEMGAYGKSKKMVPIKELVDGQVEVTGKISEPLGWLRSIERMSKVNSEALVLSMVAKHLSRVQQTTGKVWGKRTLTRAQVERTIVDAWTGKNGHYADIFPEYSAANIPKNSITRIEIERLVANTNPKFLRLALSAVFGTVLRRGVLESYSMELPQFSRRVGDAVNAISGDFAEVVKWQNMAALANRRAPRAADMFQGKLQNYRWQYQAPTKKVVEGLIESGRPLPPRTQLSGLRIDTGKGKAPRPKLSKEASISENLSTLRSWWHRETRGVNDAKYHGNYVEEVYTPVKGVEGLDSLSNQILRETVMMTTQIKHEVFFGGSPLMRAKLKTDAGRGQFAAGLSKAEKVQASFIRNARRVRNVTVRPFSRGAHAITVPARVLAVAVGAPILFSKHLLNDMLIRNGADRGWRSVTGMRRIARAFEKDLEMIRDTKALDDVMFQRDVTILTEQHYNVEGGFKVRRVARKAFDSYGFLSNFDAVYANVRRITGNEAFKAFVEGGVEGLDAWLRSDAGIAFLRAGGHTRAAKAGGYAGTGLYKLAEGRGEYSATSYVGKAERFMTELDLPKSEAEALKTAQTLYKQEALMLFSGYEALPMIETMFVKMAKGELPRTRQFVRKELKRIYDESNGVENPTLDIPVEFGNVAYDAAYGLIKAAMYPNRQARSTSFAKVFHEVFTEQMKNGLKADEAAPIAATAARMATNRTHFDLSQAWAGEIKYRWFAWFATKHRLWNTWLLRASAKYPGYAMAFEEYMEWMNERNEDESIPEWQKLNVVTQINGRRFVFNMAPWMWLSPYPLNSPLGYEAEGWAVGFFNQTFGRFGLELKPTENPFEASFFRGQSIISAIHELYTSPAAQLPNPTREDWVDWAATKSAERQAEIYEDVVFMRHIYQARGEDVPYEDLFGSVLAGNVRHELGTLGKPASTVLYGPEHTQFLKDAASYEQAVAEGRGAEFLYENPLFSLNIGAGQLDPWKQEELNTAKSLYWDIKMQARTILEGYIKTGELKSNPELLELVWGQENDAVDQLRLDVPLFDQWYSYSGEGLFDADIRTRYAFPTIKREDWPKIMVPLQSDINEKRDELKKGEGYTDANGDNYVDVCNDFDIAPGSRDSLLERRKYNQYVQAPLEMFAHTLPGDLSSAERSNYRRIMDTEEGTLRDSEKYYAMMTSVKMRSLCLVGLSGGRRDWNNLMMAVLSPQEKQFIDLSFPDPGAVDPTDEILPVEKIWDLYALAIHKDPDNKEAIGQRFQQTFADPGPDNDNEQYNALFRAEWLLSTARIDQRLDHFGFGEGDTNAHAGWRKVIEWVDEYWGKLDAAGLKTGGGDTAQDLAKPYLRKLAELAESNPEWYADYRLLKLTPSKFGFSSGAQHEGGEDAPDAILWRDYETEIEEDLFVGFSWDMYKPSWVD